MKLRSTILAGRPRRGNGMDVLRRGPYRHAFQGDLKSLDPYTVNETFTVAMLGNVYEGLTRRDGNLKIFRASPKAWETPEPTRWRFHLRKGVKFARRRAVHRRRRASSPSIASVSRNREFKTRVPIDAKIVKIDDYTVDFVLTQPDPNLIGEWDTWYILSKLGRGQRRDEGAAGDRRAAQRLCAEVRRHRPLCHHQPRARREDDV